jgi:type II secretory pathway component PulF
VIPKYQGIFHDFHVELPWSTRFLLTIGNYGSALPVVILVLTLAPLGRAVSRLFPNARQLEPFGGVLWDQMVWWTPMIGGFVRDRCMAELCDTIDAGVDAGFPLNESLREAAAAQGSAVMRYRAVAWAEAVGRGQPMHEAARYARMPRLFTSMLATVRNETVFLQVLGFLRRSYEYRFTRTRAIAQSLCVPVVVFFFGAIVALVGTSLLQPIAMLSEHIARQISGGF